ncbi:MAG: NACHT and WD repeat domain-containing protein, partial [Xenococcus sp. (in: cyanobacteria)]
MATNQGNDSPTDPRGDNITNINLYGGNYNENIEGNYHQNGEIILQRDFIVRSPYKGLKRFNAKDKDLFFGREKLIQKLITAIQQSNLVLVLGASGSGKSSVVRAGVIPQIENLAYQSCLFTPNRDPFVSFHRSLLDPEKDIFKESEVEFVLQGKSDTLSKTVALLRSKNSQWLIFVDQFEELFTSCSNIETRHNFIQGIVDLAQDKNQSVKLILAMRSDFLEELGTYPKFSEIAEKNINLVANMQTEELRQAIEQPAAKYGVVFESGLMEEIIKDVQGQAGSLPLLQYTLDLLWQESDFTNRTLKSETYRQLGGVSGALQKHVNQIYQDLSPEQQLATKQILLRLVDVVALEQSEVLRTAVSRRTYKSEFTDTQAETVQLLVDRNLLISDDEDRKGQATVEIAHEALLTSWAELKDWISDARNTISLNNRLAEDAARWQSLKSENQERANEELWTGSKLEKAIELRKDGTFDVVLGGLSESINGFIDASIEWRDRKLKELRQRTLRLGILSSCAIVFALAASFLGIISYFNSQEAQLEKQVADIKAKLSLDNEIERLLETIELVGKNQKLNQISLKPLTKLQPEVQSVLYQAVQDSREKYTFNGHESDVSSVTISEDGNYIVSGSTDNTVKLWSVENRELLHTFNGHENSVNSVAISEDGNYIISGSNDKTVKLWSVENRELLHTFNGHENSVNSVAISEDGNYIVSGSLNGEVKLWSVENRELLHTFNSDESEVLSVAISEDGNYIISGSTDNTVKLWSVENRELLHTFNGHENSVNSVTISEDGNYIVSGSTDNTVKLWSVENRELLHTFNGHENSVNSVAISE